MTLAQLINRVRSITRDFNGSIFREQDIIDFINEGIDRIKSIPQFVPMSYPIQKTDNITYLPNQYHSLLSVYACSRCFFQDGQSYNAGTTMNEFESKLDELNGKIASGEVIIKDEKGVPVVSDYTNDFVSDVYFNSTNTDEDNLSDYIKFYE
jgi:hypothetical protein